MKHILTGDQSECYRDHCMSGCIFRCEIRDKLERLSKYQEKIVVFDNESEELDSWENEFDNVDDNLDLHIKIMEIQNERII